MKLSRIIITLTVCLLLVSCGFHLRGQKPSNNHQRFKGAKVYLAVASEDKLLRRQLKNDLQFSEINVVDDANESFYHLIILSSEIKKRAIGVDANGRDNEYEISYQVDFIVSNHIKNNASEAENKQLWSRRQLYLDVSDPIGKRSEEKQLLESMRVELSQKLLNYLAAIMNSSDKTSSSFGFISPNGRSIGLVVSGSVVQSVIPFFQQKNY